MASPGTLTSFLKLTTKMLLCETNGVFLDTYQFENLKHFTLMAQRRKIEVPA